MKRNACLIVLVLLLAGCAPAALEPPATPTASAALLRDAEAMAQALGITVEEALSRSLAQDAIGELGAALEAQEADTFAGLWIQHTPEYRVVVAFTRDGARTLRPYVEGTSLESLIEVRTAAVTLAELKAEQAEAHRLLEALGLPVSSGLNVQTNQVELYVTDRPRFDAALQAADARLPAHVVVITIYEPLGATPPFPVTPDASIHMPQLTSRSPAFMLALLEGTLVVQDGCLRITRDEGSSHLIVWQPDYFLNSREGTTEILDRNGVVVAQVGEAVRMGGGEVPVEAFERNLREPLPAACTGPYWVMGEIESLEAQSIPDIFVDLLGGTVLFFSQSMPAPDEDGLSGALTLDAQGCLRVGGYAILWPPDVYWRDDVQPLRFVQVEGASERTVAVLGEDVQLRGAVRTPADYRFFENKVRCEGPYWGIAHVEQVK